ncbi:hypothetical protein [Fodinicola feengrottensis]|uniref:hypothetical protein n=1 Tax=Fodinicola feengrottensis TaxID=435914 RepID=UPI0024434D1E|nr:hypothetical protein [Fodinicola feengrottensis]
MSTFFAGCAAAHADDDGAVFDGVRHLTDACKRGHSEGFQVLHAVGGCVVPHGRPVALVASVEQPPQVFVSFSFGTENRVGLVYQDDRRVDGYRPIDGGGRCVDGQQRVMAECLYDIEQA